MKDYIDSLKDQRNMFSGNTDLLPEKLAEKCSKEASAELEYVYYSQHGLLQPDKLKEMKRKDVTATDEYIQTLFKSMPAEYHETVRMGNPLQTAA